MYRLKDVATYVNRGLAPSYSDIDTGVFAFSQKCVRTDLTIAPEFARPIVKGSFAASSPAVLREGDLVVNSTGRGTLGRAAVVLSDLEYPLVADGHVTVIRVDQAAADARFVSYVLGTFAFYEQANACLAVGATNQTELNREALRRMTIALPPLDEQLKIRTYLDAETAKIDALVAQQELQRLLQEEWFRTVLVHELLPIEPPPQWSRSRLKYLFAFERSGYWGDEPKNDEDDILCVRVADFNRLSFTAGPGAETVRSVPLEQRLPRLLQRGDVLLEKSGGTPDKPVGCAVSFDLDAPAICSNFVSVLRPRQDVCPRWAGLLMAANYQARKNAPLVRQTTGIQNLDSRAYLGSEVWVPPYESQEALACRIDGVYSVVQRTIEEISQQIRFLAEHRNALITAAVTGGLDALKGVA